MLSHPKPNLQRKKIVKKENTPPLVATVWTL